MKNKKVIIIISIIILVIIVGLAMLIFTRKFDKIADMNSLKDVDSDKKQIDIYESYNYSKAPSSYNSGVPIFMYHYVRDDTGDYEYKENMVKVSTMEEHLKYIADNGYESIFMDDLESLYRFRKTVAINYDDGFICVYLYAFPLLKKYNVKATIFVIKDMIGTPGYCTLEQLHEMYDSGLVDIQIHTVTHPRLATLNYDNIKYEISECKNFIEKEFNKEAKILCYPYGSYNNLVINVAKELGCSYGLAMTGGMYYTTKTKNNYMIPRIYAYRTMPIEEYISYLKKSYVNVVW